MILVVDDHPVTRKTLTRLLSVLGWTVISASTGEEALRAMHEARQPRCVVLDWYMPGMDGAGVLRAMSDDAAVSRLPVVVYSAAAPIICRHAMQLGARACLEKARPLDELVEILHRLAPPLSGPHTPTTN